MGGARDEGGRGQASWKERKSLFARGYLIFFIILLCDISLGNKIGFHGTRGMTYDKPRKF